MLCAKSIIVGRTRRFEQEKLLEIYKKTGLLPTGYHPDTGGEELDAELRLVEVAHSYDINTKNFHIVPVEHREDCDKRDDRHPTDLYCAHCDSLMNELKKEVSFAPNTRGHGTGVASCHWFNYAKPKGSKYQYLVSFNTLTRDGEVVSNHLGKVQFMRISIEQDQINKGIEGELGVMYPATPDDWAHSEIDSKTGHFVLNTPFRVIAPDSKRNSEQLAHAFNGFIDICEASSRSDSGNDLSDRLRSYVDEQ